MIYKALYRKRKIEQYESHLKTILFYCKFTDNVLSSCLFACLMSYIINENDSMINCFQKKL